MPDNDSLFYKPLKEGPKLKQDELKAKKFIEDKGQNGDSILALINPEERELLKAYGGADEPHPLFPRVRQFYTDDGTSGDSPGVTTDGTASPNGQGGAGGTNAGQSGGVAGPADAPDTSISSVAVGPNAPAGVNTGPDGIDKGEEEDVTSVMSVPPAPMNKPSPSKDAKVSAISRAVGVMFGMAPMGPGVAMGLAQAGGQVAQAIGATAQGAADAEAAVGTGGQSPGSQGQAGIGGGQSNNAQSPGGDNNPASFDTGLMSIAPGARPPRPQQRTNLLTYAMGLLPMGMV